MLSARDVGQHPVEAAALGGVETRRRLVDDEEPRGAGEGEGDAELAAGGAHRRYRSTPSWLNRPVQRTDFFHGLLRYRPEDDFNQGSDMSARPSAYELRARDQIHKWKHPAQGWFGQTMRQIGWPLARLTTLLKNAADAANLPAVITRALAGIVGVLADAAAWAVRPDAVYAEFRKAGHDVGQRADLFALDLEQIEKAAGWLDAKYKGLAFTEGAVAGTVGAPGLIADIPALVTLNLHAIAEYATYYGFDVASQRERLFAMHVLGLASSPSDAEKLHVMAQLAKIAADTAKKKTWNALEEKVLVRVIQQIARALGIRLTKVKLAQAVPIMGAAVGGGFNAYYTARVCDTAYHLYRERFLAEKYGPEIIDLTAEPVEGEGFEPRYPEVYEEIPLDVR